MVDREGRHDDVTFWYAYLAVVVPLAVAMVLAMWRPRWWQWVLLLVGPLVTTLAAAEVPLVEQTGWPATIGVAYGFLLVPPVLAWRRRWARWSIPAAVLLICVILAAAARFEPAILFFLGFPALLSLGVLVALLVTSRRRRSTSTGVPGSSAPTATE